MQGFYDCASIVLTLMMLALASFGLAGDGPFQTGLKVTRLCCVAFLPLGIEVAAFDRPEWNLHFAAFQASYGIAPWFTNADLFTSALVGAFSVSVFLHLLRRDQQERAAVQKGLSN